MGTLLTCSEAWYNLTETDLLQLEQVDKALWCSQLEVSSTVPYDLVCLELGLEPLRYIIMKRRLIYLQHILKQKETSLIKKFLKTQAIDPKKKDWVKTVKDNLKELDIKLTIEEIEDMPKQTYKKLIKKSIKEISLKYLLRKRNNRNGKGMNMVYSKLGMQNYLISEDLDIPIYERKHIFQIRTKMHFKIKTHFRNMHEDIICEGCRISESTTKHTLECNSLIGMNELVTYLPKYEDIYGEDVNEQVYISRILRDNIRRLPQ